MKMNLPNKLTMTRVLLIPFFVVFLLVPITGEMDKWIALTLFVIASLTDLADGRIARKYHLITDFGKFMDPLADKLLVCSAMICLTTTDLISDSRIPAWIVVIIIAREFIISGFRLVAAEKGVVIAASWWGKWKTAVTMIAVIAQLYLLNEQGVPGVVTAPDEVLTGGPGFVPAVVYAQSASPVYVYACLFVYGLFWIATILTVVSLVDYIVKNKEVLS